LTMNNVVVVERVRHRPTRSFTEFGAGPRDAAWASYTFHRGRSPALKDRLPDRWVLWNGKGGWNSSACLGIGGMPPSAVQGRRRRPWTAILPCIYELSRLQCLEAISWATGSMSFQRLFHSGSNLDLPGAHERGSPARAPQIVEHEQIAELRCPWGSPSSGWSVNACLSLDGLASSFYTTRAFGGVAGMCHSAYQQTCQIGVRSAWHHETGWRCHVPPPRAATGRLPCQRRQ
jgi:hypothetical protein